MGDTVSEGDVVDEGGDVDGDGEESADLRVGAVGMGIGHLHLLCWLGVRGASAVAVADGPVARFSSQPPSNSASEAG